MEFYEFHDFRPSVTEYLNFCRHIFDSVAFFDSLITVFKLKELLDIPISYLSCGQKRRVSLVAFLMCNRDIYCFDEASSGLDSDLLLISFRDCPRDPLPVQDWVELLETQSFLDLPFKLRMCLELTAFAWIRSLGFDLAL